MEMRKWKREKMSRGRLRVSHFWLESVMRSRRSEHWAALQTGCTHQHAGSRSFLRTAKEFKVASKYLGADSSLAVIDGMQQVTTSTLKECNIFCVATRSASPRSG